MRARCLALGVGPAKLHHAPLGSLDLEIQFRGRERLRQVRFLTPGRVVLRPEVREAPPERGQLLLPLVDRQRRGRRRGGFRWRAGRLGRKRDGSVVRGRLAEGRRPAGQEEEQRERRSRQNRGTPSSFSGSGTSSSFRIDAGTSAMPGSLPDTSFRFEKRIPGTSAGSSEQWSPRPDLGIVLEHLGRHHAEAALPADPVRHRVRHEEVRDDVGVEGAVGLLAREDPRHGSLPRLRVDEPRQPGDDLLPHLLVFGAGRDDPLPFAPPHVDVDVAETHRVGLRLRPVDVRPEFALPEELLEVGLLPLASGQRHEAVLHEPGVVVHRPAPRGEAVVGEDEERVVRTEGLQRVADDVVHLSVRLLHRRRELRRLHRVVPRVERVEEAPEAVPDTVRELEDLDDEPEVLLGEEAVEHLPELLLVASTSSRKESSSSVSSLIDQVSICHPIVL